MLKLFSRAGISVVVVIAVIISAGSLYASWLNNAELTRTQEQLRQIQEQLDQENEQIENLTQAKENLEKALETLEREMVLPETFWDSNRTLTGSLSGGLPNLSFTKEIKVNPGFAPIEGEIQCFSIWVRSTSPVEQVTATIKTTQGNVTIQLRLVEGDSTYGRWEGLWVTMNILWEQQYRYWVNFWATNEAGESCRAGFCVVKEKTW